MPPATVRFVSGHYKTKQERQDARTHIRTHAANVSRWRQWTRLVDSHAAQNLAQQAPAPVFGSTGSQELSLITSAPQSTNLMQIDGPSLVRTREEDENWTQHLLFTLSVEQFFDTLNVPIRLPVESLSVLPREVTLNTLQQVYCVLDQTMCPGKQSGLNKTAVALMQQVVADTGLLHSFLFSQLVRNKASLRQVARKTEFYVLGCSAQAVQYINNRLGDPQTACDDATILAVLLLAYNGNVNATKEQAAGPTQGPLKSLQLLDLYGGMINTETTHEQGLGRMIELRGGVSQMKMPGLAQMLSYAETIHASRRLSKPRLPFQPTFNDDHDTLLRSLRRKDRRLQSLGKGFNVLGILLPNTDTQAIQFAFQRLALYTLAVEDYITGSPFGQSLVVLADQRNMCQHSLLSLVPKPGDDSEHELVHACRSAATVYSLLCVYPISAASFSELALAIKKTLSARAFEKIRREAPELVVWIVVMGAIAAIGSEHRVWFVAVLDRCLSRLKIGSWDDLKELLEKFLWLSATNDADGYDLWLEVEDSNPFKLGDETEEVTRHPYVARTLSYP